MDVWTDMLYRPATLMSCQTAVCGVSPHRFTASFNVNTTLRCAMPPVRHTKLPVPLGHLRCTRGAESIIPLTPSCFFDLALYLGTLIPPNTVVPTRPLPRLGLSTAWLRIQIQWSGWRSSKDDLHHDWFSRAKLHMGYVP